EIRNSKSETNPNQAEKAMTETEGDSVSVILLDSDFEFVSDFVLRISVLATQPATEHVVHLGRVADDDRHPRRVVEDGAEAAFAHPLPAGRLDGVDDHRHQLLRLLGHDRLLGGGAG